MSFIERLREARKNIKPSSPWIPILKEIRGQLGHDGIERISTEAIFDKLDVPVVNRTPAAGKLVCSFMVDFGWTPTRMRYATSRGRAARIRGYARVRL
jgi:hypothetical protein